MSLPLVSVVCPAFMEEAGLEQFHARLADVLHDLAGRIDYEVVYVDDGSADGTLDVMRRLARPGGRVRYLSLSRNFGKEAALAAGLDHARGDAVVTLDTDLQHPPEVIPELVAAWQRGHDVVITERQDMRYASRLHGLSARLFHGFMSRFTPGRASTSDYRLLSRRAVEALARMPEEHRYLRGLVGWLGFPTAAVPFRVEPRHAGTSRFTAPRLLALAADGAISFSRLPLRAFLFAGLVLTGLAAGYGLLLALLWAAGSAPAAAAAHVLADVQFFLTGVVLFGQGVLGEYVARTFEQVKGRPLYLLKESSPAAAARPVAPPDWPRSEAA